MKFLSDLEPAVQGKGGEVEKSNLNVSNEEFISKLERRKLCYQEIFKKGVLNRWNAFDTVHQIFLNTY